VGFSTPSEAFTYVAKLMVATTAPSHPVMLSGAGREEPDATAE